MIILDLSMPVMNGLEAAQAIRRFMPDVPIILFTQHADIIRKSLSEYGINRVVSKSDMITLPSQVVEVLQPA